MTDDLTTRDDGVLLEHTHPAPGSWDRDAFAAAQAHDAALGLAAEVDRS